MKKRILILGGDGFCGWPTALHLSMNHYDIVIVDNLSRRKIDLDLGTNSLTPIQPIERRIQCWREETGRTVPFYNFDISSDYCRLLSLIKEYRPDSIVHFAEQRAAPYSMKNSDYMRYTVDNNLSATHNILCAIVESNVDVHLVHLGTMGVYGYATTGVAIPEGYLPVKVEKADGSLLDMEIIYPPEPGSIYHMTKTQDALFFYFYNKNYGTRITDLHQGIVWGTSTKETSINECLINRFDYDGDYGTVLNRFIVQSVVGHPLTIHGTGGQTRAFINLQDTVKCIRMAIENPPQSKERVKIFNQASETHSVAELARIVSDITGCKIRYYRNPRSEAVQNDLVVESSKFLALGLDFITLSKGLIDEIFLIAEKYKARCLYDKIICRSSWSDKIILDELGSETPMEGWDKLYPN